MPGFKLQWLSAMLALCIVASPLLGRAEGQATPAPTMDALIAREIALLELVDGGKPLSPDERAQAAEAVASAMRGNPTVWLRNDAIWVKSLQRADGDRSYAAALRRAARLTVEEAKPSPPGLEQAYAIEQQIIHAHDATVLFDPKRSHIITESTLRDLHTASAWFAEKAGVPGPSANFTDNVGTWLKANYAATDDRVANALANEAQNFPLAPHFFTRTDSKRREAVLQQVRAQFQTADTPERDVMLVVAVAIVAELCAEQSQHGPKPLPVDRYMMMMRTVVLGSTTVHSLNRFGPFSRH